MKRREDRSLKGVLGLIATVLIMLLFQVPAHGGCPNQYEPPYRDEDCDGFYWDGIYYVDDEEPPNGLFPDMFRSRPDLFVILLPCTEHPNPFYTCGLGDSLWPTNPPGILINAARDDLTLTVHVIDEADTCCSSFCVPGCVRNVTPEQKAVRIAENLSTAVTYLGYILQGTPNSTSDLGSVFTKNIESAVGRICGQKRVKQCETSDGSAASQDAVIQKYIMHTIAHEAGHAMNLTNPCSTDIGCHYPAIESPNETPTILDYNTFYTSGRGTITWYIGSRYNHLDRNFHLVP